MKKKIKKKLRVCAFGTFDILHPGHIAYLNEARKAGSTLFVIVTPDRAARRRDKKTTLFFEDDRMTLVSSLKYVDDVMLGDEDDSWSVLKRVRPDIICFGHDQQRAERSCREAIPLLGIEMPQIIRAHAYRRMKYQSSKYKQKCTHP